MCSPAWQMPIQKRALAGTGNPMNEVAWRVSMLNLANRNAEKTGMSSALNAHSDWYSLSMPWNTLSWAMKYIAINPGASPKLMRSASESSSLPSGE